MKTRTLLLLAIACGLVILVAGSVKLFLLAEEEPAAHLALGETGTAGDMTVTALAPARDKGEQLLIDVELQGVDDPDGARSFVLLSRGERLDPQPLPAGTGPECAATSASAPTRCVLAFATTNSPGLLLYERTAQDVLRWDVQSTSGG